ncbi:MAG: peroxiredoxin family protein [Proteobacteria bacterium]|nr:peroxiredoxin family protein [Pseudomonadota bacterium]
MSRPIPDFGQNAPDFQTLTSDNQPFVLSEELKSGHYVKLLFYRGHW